MKPFIVIPLRLNPLRTYEWDTHPRELRLIMEYEEKKPPNQYHVGPTIKRCMDPER